MNRLTGAAAAVAFVAAVGCLCALGAAADDLPTSQPSTQPLISRVLEGELRKGLQEVLAKGRPDNAPATRPANADPRTLEQWQARAPHLLEVTSQQEQAFEAGTFDDAANRQRVGRARKVFRDFKMDYPSVTMHLLAMDNDNPVSGARLELLSRLCDQSLQELAKAIGVSGPNK